MAWWHRVGQKVKKANAHPHERLKDEIPVGSEGRIERIVPAELKRSADCYVQYEGRESYSSGIWSDLEPIMPEGNKVVSWSECLWDPSHLNEKARDLEHS